MAGLSLADAPAWYRFVSDYPAAHAQFTTNYNALLRLRPYVTQRHPELLAQYNQMVLSGSDNARKLASLSSVRNTAMDWLGAAGRFVGLNGLGILPVVAIGVISAGATLAAVGYWVTDAYKFAQKLNALQALEARGLSPQAAAEVIQKTLGDKPFSLFGVSLTPVLLGAGLLAAAFFLYKRKRS